VFPLAAARLSKLSAATALLPLLALAACDGTLDAGSNQPRGQLPVGAHNPVILINDAWLDNWAGEAAVLLANNAGPSVVGLVVDASNYWPDLAANLSDCGAFVKAARDSRLSYVPDPLSGSATPLTVPSDQKIESTVPLRSAGAQAIVDLSRRYYLPGQPVTVVTGTQLTDLADAYLIDATVVERVTVVAALGTYAAPKGAMTGANGDLDPWADWIVAQRFSYVQVSVTYSQGGEITADDVVKLPANPLGGWMAAKVTGGKLSGYVNAADQLAVFTAGVPGFATTTVRCAPDVSTGFAGLLPGQGPPLVPDDKGSVSLVTQVATADVRTQLWRWLQNPATFSN
jgi:hypothetical protein